MDHQITRGAFDLVVHAAPCRIANVACHVPLFRCSLLHQKLQMLNCCIAKRVKPKSEAMMKLNLNLKRKNFLNP